MKTNKMNDYVDYKHSILDKNFSKLPLHYIDIGARGGRDSFIDALHEQVSFLGFEPDLNECEALNNNAELKKYWREFSILPHALANDSGQRSLYMMSAPTNTSLLQPNAIFINRYNMQAKWSVVEKQDLSVVPLDAILPHKQNIGEIIKIDTQGTEYEILQGGKNLLQQNTLCVIAEVEFFPVYKDQKLFSDVELLLREFGFSFYGFLTQHTRGKKLLNKEISLGRERLFYADAIFFKDPLSSSHNLTERQLLVLITAACLTAYYDFALELIAADLLNLSAYEKQQLQRFIRSLAYVQPSITKDALCDLVDSVKNDESRTNLHVGKFIDALNFPNFEDVSL